MCYKGEEKHGEKREERQLERERERDRWKEERPKLVTVRVWGENKQSGEWESEKTYHDRENAPKNYVSAIDEDNIYKRCNAWEREIVFQKKNGKQPLENKSYFY